MKAKDLFIIILKVFGIYLIKDVLVSIPMVLDTFYKYFLTSADIAVFSLFVSIIILGCYSGIVYILLFKTNWIISKLQLTTELSEEPLVVNLHRSSVYTIAIIVSGILILSFAVPKLVQELYAWYQYIDSGKTMFADTYFNYGRLVERMAEVIIGLLFLGNQKTIVHFIELRRRRANVESADEE